MKKFLLILVTILSFATAANAQSALTDFVNIMNKECPADLGDGMSMQKVFIEGNNVVFKLQVDDSDIVDAINQMPELMNQFGEMMLGSLAMDEGMHMIFSMMVQEKKNLVFRFTSPGTSKVGDLTIKSSKLAEAI